MSTRLLTPFPFLKTHTLTPRSRRFSSIPMAAAQKKVLIPIADGTEPIEAVIPADVLRRSGAAVTLASVHPRPLIAADWGINVLADALLSDCADHSFDLISLPGGISGSVNLRDCAVLEKIVKRHAEEGKVCAAICAAPAVALGEWGLLKGVRATCYPTYMEKMPEDAVKGEGRVEVDGKVVTSRGPGTAIEYSLALVEKLYGKEKADEVAGAMVMRPHHGVDFSMKELNPVEWKHTGTPQILVPIANGSEEMEAVMIIDILRRAKAHVTVVSVEDKLEIVASRNVKLVADILLDDALQLQYDLIVLPGGLPGAEACSRSEKLVGLLKKQAESNKLYGAMCASPAIVLEPHGLLKGKKGTSYPALCNRLTDQSECENRVLVDGNLITSQGPGTTMEFALSIVEKLFGRERALEISKTIVFT